MKYVKTDYNEADTLVAGAAKKEWADIEAAIISLPLFMKRSAQAGKEGRPIFAPVATNKHFVDKLAKKKWSSGAITGDLKVLGKDVDFCKSGVVMEVQFSNYPFLLNNVIRAEMFYRDKMEFGGVGIQLIVVVMKCGMFPSSNSSLYYEQAVRHMDAMEKRKLFTVPVRLVGLCTDNSGYVDAQFVQYTTERTSRTPDGDPVLKKFWLQPSRKAGATICKFVAEGEDGYGGAAAPKSAKAKPAPKRKAAKAKPTVSKKPPAKAPAARPARASKAAPKAKRAPPVQRANKPAKKAVRAKA